MAIIQWTTFSGLLSVLVLSLILYYPLARHRQNSYISNLLDALKNKWFIFFLLAGFSASLPLMLVSRQQDHYLLQAYPLFTVAFAQLLNPVATLIITAIAKKPVRYVAWLVISLLLGIIAIMVLIANFGKLGA